MTPATSASASPICTIIEPKTLRSLISVAASGKGDAAALAQTKEFLNIGFAHGRRRRIHDLHALQSPAQAPARVTGSLPGHREESGLPIFSSTRHVAGAQDFFIVASGNTTCLGFACALWIMVREISWLCPAAAPVARGM